MGKKEEDTGFTCFVCKNQVRRLQKGSYRNHCPFCLASLHVDDIIPGDRKSRCLGIMVAAGLIKNSKKGWQIVHQCTRCGALKVNKIAENCEQSDDWHQLIVLSIRTMIKNT